MKISVVTVCYNSAKTIGYTLDSFFRQDYPDKEIVIVDGASTDETISIIRSFPREQMILVSEPDRGIYDAMNKGLKRFTGDAVGFLNSDDRFHDSHVVSQIAMALEQADVAFGNIDFIADHISNRVVRRWHGSPYKPGAFRRGWMPAHPSFYVRRSVAVAVGPFNLSYPIAADYDWMLRAFELNEFSSFYLDRSIVDMQNGGSSTAGICAWVRGNLESLEARRQHFGSGLVDRALFLKPLSKAAQFLVG